MLFHKQKPVIFNQCSHLCYFLNHRIKYISKYCSFQVFFVELYARSQKMIKADFPEGLLKIKK